MVHVLVGKFQLRQGKLGSGEKCITRLFDSDPSAIMSKIWGFKRSVFVSVEAHGEKWFSSFIYCKLCTKVIHFDFLDL